MDEKTVIEKLTRISDAWKAQFQPPYKEGWEPVEGETPPDLPLVWSIQDGILFLDDVWITPVKFLRQDTTGGDLGMIHAHGSVKAYLKGFHSIRHSLQLRKSKSIGISAHADAGRSSKHTTQPVMKDAGQQFFHGN